MKHSRGFGSEPLISLLTDFGLKDPFVGEMKAIILSICPSARIVDITHEVEKFNIRSGSFLLAGAVRYFPSGTVHLAVVDPGVGSKRRPIVVQSPRSLFVGPDNGLLIPAAQAEGETRVFELKNRKLTLEEVSTTFHGRDIFAPAAAHLACGFPVNEVGPEITDYVKPCLLEPKYAGDSAKCEIVYVDSFGNLITNLPSTRLAEMNLHVGTRLRLTVGNRKVNARLVRTYSDLKKGEVGVLEGSHGFVEIAAYERSVARFLRARSSSTVRFYGVKAGR